MRITGTRGNIDVEYGERVARFDGELGKKGFYAIEKTMRWLPPNDHIIVSEEEKAALVKAVLKESEGKDFKIYFE